ncbi:YchJ family protein [Waterburya agarophytonicola K14]|uniref:YchJ family protein n=1 Tax=Waterburya agarophytonicola KI4 TaxID=2874699 RepID=A0A964BPJ8_9CYAN|nr:YchJ family protein [Waterburya agarophytonicola]MCC0176919.1 YchJ family protein [Waterburya agarophytonicola KI4]
MTPELCPCQSKKADKYCCGMYLSGKKKPETAEKLMRSRYTAFYRGNIDYLIATLHPDKRNKSDRAQLSKSISNTEWLGLTIINTQKGKKNDTTGIVEFEAVYQVDLPEQLHERSRFIKVDGQWFYVDGDILPGTTPKSKETCWCGSGKKYQECHGN